MKILLAAGGKELNMAAVDFSCYLANLTRSAITGVFIEKSDVEEALADKTAGVQRRNEHANLRRFKEACTVRETVCSAQYDRHIEFAEIIEESRFADFLIVDPAISFQDGVEDVPTSIARKILMKAECPVVVAPEASTPVTELLFAYDGSKSAMFAIKQFVYLFPQLRNRKLNVLEINRSVAGIDEKPRLTEWLKEHFTDVNFLMLTGDEQNRLLESALTGEGCFVIMGAYGRGLLSNFFKESHAEKLIRMITQPLFIAHM